MNVEEIGLEELKAKVDRCDDFKLVMTFHGWAFEAKHIPGSINVPSMEEGKGLAKPEDEIVVYCINPGCQASIQAYMFLKKAGFQQVRRFSGGLAAWEAAGYPLAGKDIDKDIRHDDRGFRK